MGKIGENPRRLYVFSVPGTGTDLGRTWDGRGTDVGRTWDGPTTETTDQKTTKKPAPIKTNRLLATLERTNRPLRVYLAAPAAPDADGQTPAVILAEGAATVTVHVHELALVARLLADCARLLATADAVPAPEDIVWRRRHRAHVERQAEHGDPTARAERDRLAKAARE